MISFISSHFLSHMEGSQITLLVQGMLLLSDWLFEVFRSSSREYGHLSSSEGQKVWSWSVSNLSFQEASQGSLLLYASPPNWYRDAQAHDDHHKQPTDNPGGNERSPEPNREKTLNITS